MRTEGPKFCVCDHSLIFSSSDRHHNDPGVWEDDGWWGGRCYWCGHDVEAAEMPAVAVALPAVAGDAEGRKLLDALPLRRFLLEQVAHLGSQDAVAGRIGWERQKLKRILTGRATVTLDEADQAITALAPLPPIELRRVYPELYALPEFSDDELLLLALLAA
ncbi:helix-turn-helix domain-containing protein [Baekduia soli]|uniref:Helix-turn-helix domain-containing protein n=1 Tax=Baekduia soli TaxID=496014 RepID=A0A5B8U883_9ACTN|nr:helix-turn-helix domain-containing protein [Baekduia soli]QEC49230.1 helix-turn-helix domain-containing protein [Baekduia soli]